MRTTFNVLTAPWIPVVAKNGTRELLGIRETLRRAPELKEISIASPLEEYALYRFLCVFLIDALRPQDEWDLQKIICDGKFDTEKLETYITLCESEGVSFDLFDKERPFMQSAYFEPWDKAPKFISNIDCFMPSGNNHVHFDHKWEDQQSISIDRAARLLLVIQQFCTASVQGYPSGVNASPPYFGVIKGASLHETLACTLLPIEDIGIPFDDPPVIWRSTEPVIPKREVEQTSWLRGMFFPARRVKLLPPADGENITHMYMAQGENFVNKTSWTDPFVSYRTVATGRAPFRPNGEKPVWQSLCDIIDIPGHHASLLLTQHIRMTSAPYVKITLYGVETNQASYIGIMRHDLQFRSDITESEQAITKLKQCVASAARIGNQLYRCLNNINALPQSIITSTVNHYYEHAEERFWQLCGDISINDNDTKAQHLNWCDAIGRHAKDAYNDAMKNINLRGRKLALAAEQERWLYYEIKKSKEESHSE